MTFLLLVPLFTVAFCWLIFSIMRVVVHGRLFLKREEKAPLAYLSVALYLIALTFQLNANFEEVGWLLEKANQGLFRVEQDMKVHRLQHDYVAPLPPALRDDPHKLEIEL